MTPARLEEVERDLKQIRQCYGACVPPSVMLAVELLKEVKWLTAELDRLRHENGDCGEGCTIAPCHAALGEEPTP